MLKFTTGLFNLNFFSVCLLEFLNVDDEGDYDEEANDDLPNPEELHSFENSGWSSRTRCSYVVVLYSLLLL